MFVKNHYFFYFLSFLIIFSGKNSSGLDDSDILIDRVFITAVKKKNYQKVEEMLDNDAAVNYQDSKNLGALAYALENDDKRMFELLIANGADSKQKILNKSSLLIYYVSMNRYLLIEDLIKTGIDLNFQDRLGMTALMHSIEKENINAINILLKYEVDNDLTDFSGKTIFDYSNLSRNLLVKRLIKSLHGAN
tara:strand:- start:1302 stop:1877 length:576 start_codon:yes stop_codon:yes gene_type:complete